MSTAVRSLFSSLALTALVLMCTGAKAGGMPTEATAIAVGDTSWVLEGCRLTVDARPFPLQLSDPCALVRDRSGKVRIEMFRGAATVVVTSTRPRQEGGCTIRLQPLVVIDGVVHAAAAFDTIGACTRRPRDQLDKKVYSGAAESILEKIGRQ